MPVQWVYRHTHTHTHTHSHVPIQTPHTETFRHKQTHRCIYTHIQIHTQAHTKYIHAQKLSDTNTHKHTGAHIHTNTCKHPQHPHTPRQRQTGSLPEWPIVSPWESWEWCAGRVGSRACGVATWQQVRGLTGLAVVAVPRGVPVGASGSAPLASFWANLGTGSERGAGSPGPRKTN